MPVLRASCAARVCQNFAIEEGDGSDGAKRAMHAKSAAAVLLERNVFTAAAVSQNVPMCSLMRGLSALSNRRMRYSANGGAAAMHSTTALAKRWVLVSVSIAAEGIAVGAREVATWVPSSAAALAKIF